MLEVGGLETEFVRHDMTLRRLDRMFHVVVEWSGVRREWLLLFEFQREPDEWIGLRLFEYELESL